MFSRLRNAVHDLFATEIPLQGVTARGTVRVGDTVRRPMMDKSAFVHGLLRHLERRKFDRVPRFLGIDEKGRAKLTYISGDVFHRVGGFQREQWRAAASLLKQFHDATADCELKGASEVVCHGDPCPANCVFRDDMPFGLIDFDDAHPGRREEDVGYAAWMWLDIGNDALAPAEQGSKLAEFVAAYDPAATWNPVELVLEAQHALVARLPKDAKWQIEFIKKWAQGCIDWTERNREGMRLPDAR